MKKTLSFLLAMVMVLSFAMAALAQENPITIQFWHTRGSGANYEVVEHSVKTFNETVGKEKGIVVEEVFIGSYDDILPKVQLSIQAGEQPQIAVMGNTFTGYLIEDEVVADMASYAEASGFDRNNLFDPFLSIYGNRDGELHVFPYIRSTPVLYYNKTMADEKGLTPPTTIAEMVEFCKALYEVDAATGEVLVHGLEIVNDWGYYQAANLQQLGSIMFSEDGKSSPTLEDGTTLQILTDWRGWVDEGWCRSFDSTNAGTAAQERFFQKKLAALYQSSGSMKNILINAGEAGFEVGVMPYPTYDAEKPIAEIGGGNLVVISEGNTDEQIAASWEFIQFLMSDEMVAYNTINSGYVPVTKSVAEYADMVDFWAENPLYKVAYDQMATAKCQEDPYVPFLQDYTKACWDAVSLLIQEGSITPEQALEQIKTTTASFFK